MCACELSEQRFTAVHHGRRGRTALSRWAARSTLLHSVYDQVGAVAVQSQFDKVLDALAGELPAVGDHLEAARADVLAFTTFPKEVWRQIWSNNPN